MVRDRASTDSRRPWARDPTRASQHAFRFLTLLLAIASWSAPRLQAQLPPGPDPLWVTPLEGPPLEPGGEEPDDWLGGPGGSTTGIGAIAFGPGGDIWLAGASGSFPLPSQPLLFHLTSSGLLLGLAVPATEPPGPVGGRQAFVSVSPLAGGGVAATGYLTVAGELRPILATFDDEENLTDQFLDPAVDSGLAVGGFEQAPGDLRLIANNVYGESGTEEMVALDGSLEPIWRSSGEDRNCGAVTMERDAEGSVWTAGWSWRDPKTENADCHVVGFGADGAILDELYVGAPSTPNEACTALALHAGRIIVGGYSLDANGWRGFAGAFAPDGSVDWFRRGEITPGETWTGVDGVAANSDGDSWVAGEVQRTQPPGHLPAVARFAADGSLVWFSRLDGYGSATGAGFVVDSEGFAYLLSGGTLFKLAPDGEAYWAVPVSALTAPLATVWGKRGLSLDADENPLVVVTAQSGDWDSLEMFAAKVPGRRDIFRDGFRRGDTSRWSATQP